MLDAEDEVELSCSNFIAKLCDFPFRFFQFRIVVVGCAVFTIHAECY